MKRPVVFDLHGTLAETKWDSDFAKQEKIKAILDAVMPGCSVRIPDATSIDATKPGDDWAGGHNRPNGSPNPRRFDVP